MRITLFGLLLISFLSGCSTVTEPVPKNYRGSVVTLHDSLEKRGTQEAYFFEVSKINGNTIQSSSMATYDLNQGRGFNMTPALQKRQVPAKNSVLSIQAVTYFAAPILAFGGGNYHIEGDVNVNLQAGKTYYVKGKLSKKYKAVWVEDNNGKIISRKIEQGIAPLRNKKTPTKLNSKNAVTVTLYNSAGFMYRLDGSGKISIKIDDIDYGVLSPKQYTNITLASGEHTFQLSHRDMINFKSQHTVNINQKNNYYNISPTMMSNSFSKKASLPKGYKKISLKK